MNTELTIRDMFAMNALNALISRDQKIAEAKLRYNDIHIPQDTTACWDQSGKWETVAVASYAIADAMLIARQVTKQ